LEHKILGDKLFAPIVLGEVVLKNELGVVRIPEEVAFAYWLYFVVKELERVLV
jgi:hypothetical protein